MKPIGTIVPAIVNQVKQRGSRQPLSAQPKTQDLCLKNSNEAKKALNVVLQHCFQALRLYGKEPEALESAVALFELVLADYSFAQIEQAFRAYLRQHNEMPAPADIASIIDRGGRPAFDRLVYGSLTHKQPELRSDEEWQYMREYEAWAISGG